MISSTLHNILNPGPAHFLLFELLAGSSVIGLTAPTSLSRPLAVPLIAASVYGTVRTAAAYIGSRHAPLIGGFSCLLLLRYIDAALISRWDFNSQGPTIDVPPERHSNVEKPAQAAIVKDVTSRVASASIWSRFCWGWRTLWSFRQVGTPYEIRNTPPFSSRDPDHVPSRWPFVIRKMLLAGCCYLVLDLLAQSPPPTNAATIFNPALIPFLRRLSDVTLDQVKLRVLSTCGFGVTFYCIIQGVYSAAAAVGVATGMSKVSSWRPAFGPLSEAYTVGNFWGKVWHQYMRQLLVSPASYIVNSVLDLRKHRSLGGPLVIFLTFALSGMMHMVAARSSGQPIRDAGALQFFCTQALGVTLEIFVSMILQSREAHAGGSEVALGRRILGYLWVFAFLSWSGPAWLYPSAARQTSGRGAGSFVPYSVIKLWFA